ncbi:DUF551 domain-containing protein [Salmonella enterica]|nr:DUF551 domain-containing protein [Salmonella enterica subsp. enterica]EGL1837376.1 DUF551 domain-containing protein [Salmonella enterica]ELN6261553.1 DUF551 domain-containing protein [Salmonella enterica]HAF1587619.1 DUF551 domain-containing protein [Salmonella enterica]
MTITKERLLKIQHWRETYGADSNVMLPAEEAEELAHIALAALEVAPVGEVSEKRHGLVMDGTVDLGGKSTYRIIKGEKAMKRLPLGTKFYIAPPAPVVPDGLRQALSNAGIAAPESDEMLAATSEKYIQMLVTWVKDRKPFQPAPVVPETLPCSVELKPGLIIGKGCKTETLLSALQRRYDYNAEIDAMTPEERAERDARIEAFKAMLPTPADSYGRSRAPVVPPAIEPDYEVIKAIIPTANPDEYACCIAADMWNACRAAMLQGVEQPQNARQNIPGNIPAGKSTLTPDGWISCSERMPEDEQEVIVQNKLGYRYVSYFDEHSGLFFDMPGGNQMNCIEHILVTHWMPLPAPPQH